MWFAPWCLLFEDVGKPCPMTIIHQSMSASAIIVLVLHLAIFHCCCCRMSHSSSNNALITQDRVRWEAEWGLTRHSLGTNSQLCNHWMAAFQHITYLVSPSLVDVYPNCGKLSTLIQRCNNTIAQLLLDKMPKTWSSSQEAGPLCVFQPHVYSWMKPSSKFWSLLKNFGSFQNISSSRFLKVTKQYLKDKKKYFKGTEWSVVI